MQSIVSPIGFEPHCRPSGTSSPLGGNTVRPERIFGWLEDKVLLPHIKETEQFDLDVVDHMKRGYLELNSLVRKLNAVSFESDADRNVVPASRALVELATKLDDLIDSEELYTLPTLRKTLFAREVAMLSA